MRKSEKKHAKKVADFQKYLLIGAGIVNAIYLFTHIRPYWKGELEFWDYVGAAYFMVITYFSYRFALNTKELYGEPETSLDIFIVNLIVQFVVSFTRKGWYLYFLVAGYAVYKGVKFVMDLTSITGGEPEEAEEGKGKKKKEKRREREEKPRVKYVKH